MDSSVAAKWFFPEIDSERANLLRDAWKFGAIELFAPPLFLAELGNLLWKKVVLRHEISASEAKALFAEVVANPLSLVPATQVAERALGIAVEVAHPVYDCFYIAAAEHLGCDLITADERMAAKFSAAFPFVRRLSSI